MGFINNLVEIVQLQEKEDRKKKKEENCVLLATVDFVNREDYFVLVDLIKRGKFIVLDLNGMECPEEVTVTLGSISRKLEDIGGGIFSLGSQFYIAVPNRSVFGILYKAEEVDSLIDEGKDVVLVSPEYIDDDKYLGIADLAREKIILILNMGKVKDMEVGARAMEFACGAIKSSGSWQYAMGSDYFISLPNKDNYSVLTNCKEKYAPETRGENGDFIIIK